jgi:hemerythrin-like domain-containing protein
MTITRRTAFVTVAGAGALLAACRRDEKGQAEPMKPAPSGGAPPKEVQVEEVGAVEDLMREHGVIRRVLVVYREAAARLRAKTGTPVPADALQSAAKLMRSFGEDYHEKQLEEAHIFPSLLVAAGPLAAEVNTLIAQHERGREITDYVLAVTARPIDAAVAGPLARMLDAFARMYEEHAAREDTLIFPAWKATLSAKQLDEMGDLFEDIEKKTFGKDGFEDALRQVTAIEKGIALDPVELTAPAPPKTT